MGTGVLIGFVHYCLARNPTKPEPLARITRRNSKDRLQTIKKKRNTETRVLETIMNPVEINLNRV